MPKTETSVYRRSGFTNWQLRIQAPKTSPICTRPTESRGVSLNTSDLMVAGSLALAKRAEPAFMFAELRTELKAEKVNGLTPALIQELAARVATASSSVG